MELKIYRYKKGLEPIILTTTNEFSTIGTWMDIKQISSKITSPIPYLFRTYSTDEYDYVLHGGNKYILFYEPTGKNQNTENKYEYDLAFYGEEVLLKAVLLRDVVKSGIENEQEVRYNNGSLVEFFGGAKEFAQRLQANIDNQLGSNTWKINVDVSTEFGLIEKFFVFDGMNCWEALKAFNQDVNINFYIDTTHTISGSEGLNILTITDKEQFVIPYVFEQGYGKGLYDITKTESSGTEIVTRIYPQGGDRNIPIGYKQNALPVDKDRYSPFLLLPNNSDGTIRYYYDDIEGIKKFGIRPKSEKFDYLYPSIYDTRLENLYPEKLVGGSFPSGTIGNDGVDIGGLKGDMRIDGIVGCDPIVETNQPFFNIYTTDLGFFLDKKVPLDDEIIKIPLGSNETRYRSPSETIVNVLSEYSSIPSEIDITIPAIEVLLPNKATGKVWATLRTTGNETIIKYGEYSFSSTENYHTFPSINSKTLKGNFYYRIVISYDVSEWGAAIFDSPMTAYFGGKNISYIKKSTVEYYKYYTTSNAIISMRDGRYAGYDFTIQKDGTKKLEPTDNYYSKGARYSIKLARFEDSGSLLPSVGAPMAANERFVILGINLPDTYVTMAENRLLQVSKEFLTKNNYLKNSISLNIATGFTIENPVIFEKFVAGNVCKVKDAGIDLPERGLTIDSVTVQYTNDTQYPKWSCTLSDVKTYGRFEQLSKDISSSTRTQQSSTALTAETISEIYKKLSVFDSWFELDENLDAIKAKKSLYTNYSLSAKGLASGSGGGGGASSLGQLVNVGTWADETATYDRIMVQLTGSSFWTEKKLSDIVGLDTTALAAYLTTNEYITKTLLTTALSGYATESWVNAKGYLVATSTDKANWNLAFANQHTHANKSVLDGVTSALITNWNTAFSWGNHASAGYLKAITKAQVEAVLTGTISSHDHDGMYYTKVQGDAKYALISSLSAHTTNGDIHVTKVLKDKWDAAAAKLDKMFGWHDSNQNVIKALFGLYTDQFLSAKGLAQGGSGGGGGTSYDRLDSWNDYTSEKAGYVLSAGLGNDLNTRVISLEAGSALSLSTTGTGNVVTAIAKSGTVISVTKGLTAILEGDARLTDSRNAKDVYDWAKAITKPSYSYSEVGAEQAFAKNTAFNKNFGTAAGTVAQGNDSRIINGQTAFGWGNHASAGYASSSTVTSLNTALNALKGSGLPTTTGYRDVTEIANTLLTFLTGTDTDSTINKWKELEAFLEGFTETDTLSKALALKADKTITISAGAGLTGGGDLSTNRSLALSASGVSAGTYKSVTVDAYGRVTAGTSPTTLAGYGITDGVNAVSITGGGNAITGASISGHGLTLTKGSTFLDKTTFDDLFVKVQVNGVWTIQAKYGLWTDYFLSAKGLASGSGGGGIGIIQNVYGYSDLGKTYSDATLTDTFNAYTVNQLANRIVTLENSSITSVPWSIITNKPTTIAGYGITDVYAWAKAATKPSYAFNEITGKLYYLSTADRRTDTPNTFSLQTFTPFFLSASRLVGAGSGSEYLDAMYLNTYTDSSGGASNLLAINKSNGRMYKMNVALNATSWNGTLSEIIDSDNAQTIVGQKTFTSGILLNYTQISDASDYIAFYTRTGGARTILAKQILLSSSYSLADSVPNTGIYAQGAIKALSFAKHGGTASQFLKADGSVDSNIYVPNAALASYVTLNTSQEVRGFKAFFNNASFNKTALAISPVEQPIVINGINNAASNGYLPAIGFHIPGITYASMVYQRDNKFGFVNNAMNDYVGVIASSFTKNGGNQYQVLRADGGVSTFNWQGQAGQPTWVWGGNTDHDYKVWNPSNFRVANANTVGDIGIVQIPYGSTRTATTEWTTNAGDVRKSGFYRANATTDFAELFIHSSHTSPDYAFQLGTAYGDGSLIFRHLIANVWSGTRMMLDNVNWTSTVDGRYLPLTGGNLTGIVNSTAAINATTLGSSGYITSSGGWFQNNTAGNGLYNSSQNARFRAQSGRWEADKQFYVNGDVVWNEGNDGAGSGLNADLLDDRHRDNLFDSNLQPMRYWGSSQTIQIDGDLNTYYPVVFTLNTDKTWTSRISISKNLGSKTAAYPGNHSNGTSSMWIRYEGRHCGWDGNGNTFNTDGEIYQGYANLIANARIAGSSHGGFIIWLRGGGTTYDIYADYKPTINVYYTRTDISYAPYSDFVEPTTTVTSDGRLDIRYTYNALGFYGNVYKATGGFKSRNICIEVDGAGGVNYEHEINDFNNNLYLQHHTSNYLIVNAGGGNTSFRNKLFVDSSKQNSDTPGISLAIGDSDTGFNWESDGKVNFMANGLICGYWQGNNIYANNSLIANNGRLYSTSNGMTVSIGSQNSSYCHYETTAPEHYFNKTIRLNGRLMPYAGAYDIGSADETFGDIFSSQWFRTTGNTGLYFHKWGGGWNMEDTTYIRSYNAKAIRTNNASHYSFSTAGGYYSGRNTSLADNWANCLGTNNGILNSDRIIVGTNTIRPIVTWEDQISGVGYDTRYSIASGRSTSGWGWMQLSVGNNDAGTSGHLLKLNGGGSMYWSGYIVTQGAIGAVGAIYSDSNIYTGYNAGRTGGISCNNWFASSGQTGWINDTYGGGIYMADADQIRVYNNKVFYNDGARTWGIRGHNCGLKLYNAAHIGLNLSNNSYTWGIYSNSDGNMYIGRRNGYANDSSGTYYLTIGSSTMSYTGVFTASVGMWSPGYMSAKGQNTSDIRLKTSIQDFDATSIIKRLAPKSYYWNDTAKASNPLFSNNKQYGLIAQDSDGVIDDFVVANMFDDGYYGIRYEKLIPIMLKGHIETIAQMENLTVRTETNEQKIERLEKRVAELEKQ